jgi:hypothetical protein
VHVVAVARSVRERRRNRQRQARPRRASATLAPGAGEACSWQARAAVYCGVRGGHASQLKHARGGHALQLEHARCRLVKGRGEVCAGRCMARANARWTQTYEASVRGCVGVRSGV